MIKKITIPLLLFLVILNANFCWGEPLELSGKENSAMKETSYKEEKYKNISSSPSFIKIRFKNEETGEIINMIVENQDMATYLAIKHGLKTDNLGRFKDTKAYENFIKKDYITYMVVNEGKVLDIDFNDFKKIISRARFGNETATEKYLNSHIFLEPMTFQELNVNSEEQFIKEFFDFGSNKNYGILKQGYKQFNSNPAFIALLIDLGYDVGRGDIVPILFIRKSQ